MGKENPQVTIKSKGFEKSTSEKTKKLRIRLLKRTLQVKLKLKKYQKKKKHQR